MAEWDAQFVVTPAEAAGLIARQFPALAPVDAAPLAAGWDNTAYLVNGQFVFRFPRRPLAVGLIEHESRALPYLAPHLPFAVPLPQFLGAPEAGYPCPFVGHLLLPGSPACRAGLSDAQRADCAVPLARFLAALHAVPAGPAEREWAPRDELRRSDLPSRLPRLLERLRALDSRGCADMERLVALAKDLASAAPFAHGPLWVHGDLYACHLLVDPRGTLTGIIDWGDAHLGDPALDLSIAFSFLPAPARSSFRAAYGTIGKAAWARARFRALHYGAVLAEYGSATGDADMCAAGETALRGVLE